MLQDTGTIAHSCTGWFFCWKSYCIENINWLLLEIMLCHNDRQMSCSALTWECYRPSFCKIENLETKRREVIICHAYSLFLCVCLFPEGVCEIWLTSEDTGAYGRDIGTGLPTLLWRLVEEIPEGAMLRLGMTNPPYILEHLEVCTTQGHPFHPELPSNIIIHHW